MARPLSETTIKASQWLEKHPAGTMEQCKTDLKVRDLSKPKWKNALKLAKRVTAARVTATATVTAPKAAKNGHRSSADIVGALKSIATSAQKNERLIAKIRDLVAADA